MACQCEANQYLISAISCNNSNLGSITTVLFAMVSHSFFVVGKNFTDCSETIKSITSRTVFPIFEVNYMERNM